MVASKRLIAFSLGSAAAAGLSAACCFGFVSTDGNNIDLQNYSSDIEDTKSSLYCTESQNYNENSHYEQHPNCSTNNDYLNENLLRPLQSTKSSQNSPLHHHRVIINAPLSRLVLEGSSANLFARADHLEKSIEYYFNDIWQDSGDSRTREFPFIGTGPWKLLYATGVYLLLIKLLLPKLMYFKTNGGFELAWPLRFYNLTMVFANIFAFMHGARILNWGLNCFGCQLMDPNDKSEQTMELLHYGWLFLMSRLIEWLDTVFFVLRKRERQITKLHIFHHSFVPLITWVYLKYHPSYTMAFFPFINSFVHSIMYSYYFLATFGCKIQPYLWWKRYLTSLQITQFVLILIQLTSIPLSANDKCNYPRGFIYFAFAGAILFLWLFYAYYIDTYTKAKTPESKRKEIGLHKSAGTIMDYPNNHIIRERSIGVIESSKGCTREGTSKAFCNLIENSIETS